MRTMYSVAGAILLLGCMDGASTVTAPGQSGGVASTDDHGTGDPHGNGDPHATRIFLTYLNGSEEVPPRETHADGHGTVRLSPDGQSVEFEVIVNNIRNVTQAHVHMAPRGANGPIVVWFYPSVKATTALAGGAGPFSGTLATGSFTAADLRGPLAGQPLQALIDAIVAGNTYVNVHTDDGVAPPNTGPGDFPGGEVRGQLPPSAP
jgi:hypothetical protein